jgi:hypothetical protein
MPPEVVLPQPPQATSLKKYGITQQEWLERVREQGGVCPICEKLPPNGRLVTDHEHVKGWKKMPPSERKLYLRFMPCLRCNLMYLPVGLTVQKAKNIVKYLEAYEKRKLEAESKSMPATTLARSTSASV